MNDRKQLLRGSVVGKGDHLVLSGKQHVVLAYDGAAAYGVNTDLAAFSLLASRSSRSSRILTLWQ